MAVDARLGVSTIAGSMLDGIGRTPLVRLRRVAPPGVEILAKIEWYGPTGSVKDRIYRQMIERAEARGDLRPGMTIMECTTGNAGIACAAVAAIKGYPCVIVMPEGMSEERRKLLRLLGADVVLTPGGGSDIDLGLAEMRRRAQEEPGRYFVPAEFENPDNVAAQRASGEEIWEQAGGQIDAVVASEGTGGWISGVAAVLKERRTDIRAFVAEPAECALIADRRWGVHGVPGVADGIVPKNLDFALLDGVVTVASGDALDMARRLAREEGILGGPSSGCNVVAALKLAAAHPELRTIVTVVPDSAMRYFSDALFGEHHTVDEPLREHGLPAAVTEQLDRHAGHLEIIR